MRASSYFWVTDSSRSVREFSMRKMSINSAEKDLAMVLYSRESDRCSSWEIPNSGRKLSI